MICCSVHRTLEVTLLRILFLAYPSVTQVASQRAGAFCDWVIKRSQEGRRRLATANQGSEARSCTNQRLPEPEPGPIGSSSPRTGRAAGRGQSEPRTRPNRRPADLGSGRGEAGPVRAAARWAPRRASGVRSADRPGWGGAGRAAGARGHGMRPERPSELYDAAGRGERPSPGLGRWPLWPEGSEEEETLLPRRRRCADWRPFSTSNPASGGHRLQAASILPSKNNPLWPAASAPPQPGSPPPPPSRRPVAGRGIKLALRGFWLTAGLCRLTTWTSWGPARPPRSGDWH